MSSPEEEKKPNMHQVEEDEPAEKTKVEDTKDSLGSELKLLLKNKEISPLQIPLFYNFKRIIHESKDDKGDSSLACYYTIGISELRNPEDLSNYLLENKMEVPISMFMFSFEPTVRTSIICSSDHWMDRIVTADISGGEERVPIPVICGKGNNSPPLALYTRHCIKAEDLKASLDHDDEFLACCTCPDDCRDKLRCECFLRTLDNCSEMTRKDCGDINIGYQYQRLKQAVMSGIFECNKRCACKSTCFNRVSQHGLYHRLQIFMTINKGWGVRTLHDIPKGTFVCNYVGKIVSGNYADRVSKNWKDGRWKYLTQLSVGEDKEGYEEEVVMPTESPVTSSNANSDIVQNQDSSVNVSSDVSIEKEEHDSSDQLEERDTESSTLNTSSTESLFSVKMPLQMQPLVCSKRIPSSSLSTTSRRLRSGKTDDHSFLNYLSPMKDNRFGDRFIISVEGHKILGVLNGLSKVRSIWTLGKRKAKPKTTKHRSLEEYVKENSVMPVPRSQYNNISSSSSSSLTGCSTVPLEIKDGIKSSRISRSLAEEASRTLKLDPSSSAVSRTDPNARRKIKRKRSKKEDSPLWQRPRILYKLSRKTTKRKTCFSTMTYAKRRRLRSKMKETAASKKECKPLHTLLRFDLNVDGMDTGNVGRYFNHSCDPNLFPQHVFIDNHDLRMPEIAFFASRNIQAGEELTWNYNYHYEESDNEEQQQQDIISPGSGSGRSLRVRKKATHFYMPCYCGQDNCTKRLY